VYEYCRKNIAVIIIVMDMLGDCVCKIKGVFNVTICGTDTKPLRFNP